MPNLSPFGLAVTRVGPIRPELKSSFPSFRDLTANDPETSIDREPAGSRTNTRIRGIGSGAGRGSRGAAFGGAGLFAEAGAAAGRARCQGQSPSGGRSVRASGALVIRQAPHSRAVHRKRHRMLEIGRDKVPSLEKK